MQLQCHLAIWSFGAPVKRLPVLCLHLFQIGAGAVVCAWPRKTEGFLGVGHRARLCLALRGFETLRPLPLVLAIWRWP